MSRGQARRACTCRSAKPEPQPYASENDPGSHLPCERDPRSALRGAEDSDRPVPDLRCRPGIHCGAGPGAAARRAPAGSRSVPDDDPPHPVGALRRLPRSGREDVRPAPLRQSPGRRVAFRGSAAPAEGGRPRRTATLDRGPCARGRAAVETPHDGSLPDPSVFEEGCMNRIRFSMLALSLALSGVSSAFGQMPKMKADLDRLERKGKQFSDAYERGDFQTIGTMYDEHAIAFPPDADMVMGRQAIQDLWKSASDSGVKSLDLTVVGAESSGNYMIETGRALLHVQPAGKPETTQ